MKETNTTFWMKPARSLFCLLFGCLVFCLSLVTFAQRGGMGELTGLITDSSGAVIADANLVIEELSTHKRYQLTSSDVGEFKVSVPDGFYRISAHKFGFCPRGRAGVLVEGDQAVINISLIVCSIDSSLIDREAKAPVWQTAYAVPWRSERFHIDSDLEGLFVEIEYGTKEVVTGYEIYGSIKEQPNAFEPARLTYNHLQVYATSIRKLSENVYQATGGVSYENGVRRSSFESVVFALQGGSVELLCSVPASF